MESLNIDQHISHKFNEDLEQLRNDLLEMGGMVEVQLADAIKAIETADSELAEKVIITEQEVDKKEIQIDHQCTDIIARRQPAASDLRLVLSAIKVTRDLERMGDEAHKIAAIALGLHDVGTMRGYVELRHLSSNVAKIVRVSLDSFARFDVQMAVKVVRGDKETEIEYQSAMRELITLMMEDPREIGRVMNMMWALRALERIGDHARNIAEHVIYLVRGKDVRHASLSEIEDQLNSNN